MNVGADGCAPVSNSLSPAGTPGPTIAGSDRPPETFAKLLVMSES